MIDRFNMYKQLLSSGYTDHGCVFCDGCESNIIRGSTRQHTFRFPFDSSVPETILIVYKQGLTKVLEKKLIDCKVSIRDGTLIYLDLSEADTLKFKPDKEVSVQLKASFKDKRVITSDIFTFNVLDVLDDKMISDESINIYALEADINAQRIEVRNDFNVVQGSDGLYKCKLLFDSTWSKYRKKAIFKDLYNHKVYTDVIEDDQGHFECILPDILIENPGWLNMGVAGSYTDGRVKAHKPTMWSRSIRIPRSCIDAGEFGKLEFEKIYVYQGAVDEAYGFNIPQELVACAATKQELLHGYTWKNYELENQYHVLAIPTVLNIECTHVIQACDDGREFTILPTSHNSNESGSYTFYYFSSKATGTFTSTYYFKEVK